MIVHAEPCDCPKTKREKPTGGWRFEWQTPEGRAKGLVPIGAACSEATHDAACRRRWQDAAKNHRNILRGRRYRSALA